MTLSGNPLPVVVFAHRRPRHLQLTLKALARCAGIEACQVMIFCDAAAAATDEEAVRATRRVARQWVADHGGRVIERERNLHFANITDGITQVCDSHGRVIVLEDDVVVSPDFLQFMQAGLDRYEHEEKVFGISGYMYADVVPERPRTFFLPFILIWGWATWARAWRHYDPAPADWRTVLSDERTRRRMDLEGTLDYSGMIEKIMKGRLRTWDAQWTYAIARQDAVALHPSRALTWNTGVACGVHGLMNQDVIDHRIDYLHGQATRRDFLQPRLETPYDFPDAITVSEASYATMARSVRRAKTPLRRLRRLMHRASQLVRSATTRALPHQHEAATCSCPVCGSDGEDLYQQLEDRLFGVEGRWRMARCRRGCGHLWLQPPPDDQQLQQAYAHYYTHDTAEPIREAKRVGFYGRLRHRVWSRQFGVAAEKAGCSWFDRVLACIPPIREQMRFDRMFLTPQPGGRLLDVGCGNGDGLCRMLDLGWHVQGVDPDPQAVKAAQARNLPVKQGDAFTIEPPKGGFDAVTLFHVIEHTPDPEALLRRCGQMIGTAGHVIVVTPNAGALNHRFFGKWWRGLEPPRHLQVFTQRSMRHLLTTCGLRPVSLTTSFRDASGMFCASHAIKRKRPHRHGQAPPRMVRCLGDLVLMIEWLAVRLGAPVGEELIVIAQRESP